MKCRHNFLICCGLPKSTPARYKPKYGPAIILQADACVYGECCVAEADLLCVQERDLKTFHEGLKQDTKLMKQSVDMLPKDLRKDVLRQRKEEKDIEQAEKVTDESFTVS